MFIFIYLLFLISFVFTVWFLYVVTREALYDAMSIQGNGLVSVHEKFYVTFWREFKRSFRYHFPLP